MHIDELRFMIKKPAPWMLNEAMLTFMEQKGEKPYLAYLDLVGRARDEIGEIKTLKGSNKKYWKCYIGHFDATFKILKRGKIIIKIWQGQKGKIKE